MLRYICVCMCVRVHVHKVHSKSSKPLPERRAKTEHFFRCPVVKTKLRTIKNKEHKRNIPICLITFVPHTHTHTYIYIYIYICLIWSYVKSTIVYLILNPVFSYILTI